MSVTDWKHCVSALCLASFWLWFGEPAMGQRPDSTPVAVIERADYQARLDGIDLVEGTLQYAVKHVGEQPAFLDWSGVQIAIHQLTQANAVNVFWGTDALQRPLVRISESLTLTGKWSLHGMQVGDRIQFELSLPPALESTFNLQLPEGYEPNVTRGLISHSPTASPAGWKVWSLELGKHRTLTLEVRRIPSAPVEQDSFCEADAVHVIRRDGIYIQTDMMFQSHSDSLNSIHLRVPKKLKIQSITSFGVQLPYERTEETPDLVKLSLNGENSRVSIRLQGMLSLNWDRKQTLPEVRPVTSTLVQKQVAVRVESPLKILNIEPHGYIQTNLSSLATGEVWNFSLVDRKGHLEISTMVPKPVSTAKLNCLLDLRSQSAWGNCLLQVASESGEEFSTSLNVPVNWEVVSVDPLTQDSKVADWDYSSGKLEMHFREPVTTDSYHALMVQVLGEAFVLNQPFSLNLPYFPESQVQQSQFYLLLPKGYMLEILEGEGWQISDDAAILPELTSQLSEELLLEVHRSQIATLTFNDSLITVPTVQLVKRENTLQSTSSTQSEPLASSAIIETDAVACTLNLSTKYGHAKSQGIVHHAFFQFDRSSDLSTLGLELASDARISSVIVDGLPVTVILDGAQVVFPSEIETVTRLEVIYITQHFSQSAVQTPRFPVPVITIPIESFEWDITTPSDHTVTGVDLPEFIWGNRAPPEPLLRFFGPLARLTNREIFQPFSPTSWKDLFLSKRQSKVDAGESELFQIFCATAPPQVVVSIRNDALLRSYAWIAFVGCLMFGTGIRMFRISKRQITTIIWLICLGFFAFLVSENWAIVAGGMLSGTIVSLLLPRKLLHLKDIFERMRSQAKGLQSAPPTIASTSICVLICLCMNGEIHSQNLSTLQQPTPAYLIESAEYQLVKYSPTPEINATFFVKLLHGTTQLSETLPSEKSTTLNNAGEEVPSAKASSETLLIQLPFQGVVFQSGATCKVDGDEQPLIPTTDGNGVLVDLSRFQFALTTLSSEEAIQKMKAPVRIELTFTIRSQPTDSTQPSFLASVPPVMNSTLQLPAELETNARWGANISADTQKIFSIGSSGKLALGETRSSAPGIEEINAVSVLNVSGLKVVGETRLTVNVMPTTQSNAPMLLKLPEHLFLKEVTGDLKSWKQITNAIGQPLLVVEWDEASSLKPEKTLLLNFLLTQPLENNDGKVRLNIPAFTFLSGISVPHKIGFTPSPGFTVTLHDPDPAIRNMGSIEWNTLPAPTKTQPAVMVELFTPLPIQLELTPLPITRTASSTETLIVRKQELHWRAVVELEVGVLPVFRHDFHITPGISITGIVKLTEDSERSVRWKQTNDNLTLFLTEGQFGKQSFVITGVKPFGAEIWRSLPAIKVPLAEMINSELTIIDETFWNLKLETSAGTTLLSPPKPSQVVKPNSRTVGIYKETQRPRPIRIQATPPKELTQVESITKLNQDQNGNWLLSTTFHFHTEEAPLRQLVFQIPNTLSQVKVYPAFYRRVTLPGENASELTIRLIGNTKTSLDVTIDAVVNTEISSAPGNLLTSIELISTTSAIESERYLVLAPASPISVASQAGQRVAVTALPAWTKENETRQTEADANHYRLSESPLETDKALTLIPSVGSLSQQAHVLLAETIFRPNRGDTVLPDKSPHSISASTQVWFSTANARELVINHSDKVVIEKVSQENGPSLPLRTEKKRCYVLLAKENRVSALTISWTLHNLEQPNLELLQFPLPSENSSETVAQQLVAVPNIPHIELLQAEPTTTPLKMWLMRWNSLLEILSETNATIPVDSLLLQTIRLCERNSQRLVERKPEPELISEFNQLQAQWDQYRKKLLVSVEDLGHQQGCSPTSFSDLLGEASREVTWIAAPSSNWNATLSISKTTWAQLFFKLLAMSCVAAFVLKYINVLIKFPDQIAKYPDLSLISLGIVWWLFLSPSFMGVVLVMCGLGIRFSQQFGLLGVLKKTLPDDVTSSQNLPAPPW